MLVENDILYTYLDCINIGRQITTFKSTRYRILITVLKSVKTIFILTINVFKLIRYKAP
jgi:hypothetical protein